MPYVEGFGTWPFGEEWLFEAVATVYVPLLEVLAGAPVTLTVTPVLADQLEALRDGDSRERYLSFLRDVRAPIHAEDAAGLDRTGRPELAAELRRAAGDYERADSGFEAIGRDLLGALRALDGLELWTSAATHAVLPMLATEPGVALQVAAAVASHRRRFGRWGGGFWLPECAYAPGLEADLAEQGVRVFCVDQTDALGLGSLDQLEPVMTPEGLVAVPIDWQTVGRVWDVEHGYPVSGAYRDYHARTLHDLRPWNIDGGPYVHDDALELAGRHARDFVESVGARLDDYADARGGQGVVCCAIDTELFGHWWYEGQDWLSGVIAEADTAGVELLTVSDAVARSTPVRRELAASSWGTPKDLTTWDSPAVAELAFAQRRAELRLVAAATAFGTDERRLARAARELLALQSSDWAFQVTRELAADYPLRRAHEHEATLEAALRPSTPVPDPRLRNLQPELDLSPLLSP
jgi:1,4-alpha-glucan branching enzyme